MKDERPKPIPVTFYKHDPYQEGYQAGIDAALEALPQQATQMRQPYGNFVEGWNAYKIEARKSIEGLK